MCVYLRLDSVEEKIPSGKGLKFKIQSETSVIGVYTRLISDSHTPRMGFLVSRHRFRESDLPLYFLPVPFKKIYSKPGAKRDVRV